MDNTTKRRSWSKRLVLTAVVVFMVAGGVLLAYRWKKQPAAVQYFTEAVQRGPVRNIVNATGTVQAVLTVQVGSQITGQIQALYADFNSTVKRGQLLARIDPRNFEAQVEQAKANVAAAEARVQTAQAELKNQNANWESSKANLEAARVTRDNTAQIFHRFTELEKGGIVSQNDYDNAKANAEGAVARYTQAEAAVEQVQAQINSAQAQLAQADAQVAQARAALNQAQVNLDYTSIYSPVDGVVISRNVDVGQTVSASLQTPTLFMIANDLTQMQVNANVDEADIGNISYQSTANFTVDAYPNRTFTGHISEIRLNPQTVQNVVTYSVIMDVDNRRLELKPGMTANLTITVAERNNVLKVPNSSLRYLPPGMDREQVAKMLQHNKEGVAPGNDLLSKTVAGTGQDEGTEVLQPVGEVEAPPRDHLQHLQEMPEAERQKIRDNFRQPSRPENGGGGRRGSRANAEEPSSEARTPSPSAPLAPGQDWNPGDKIQFPAPRQRPARPAIVWVLGSANKPEPRRVVLGITDGSATEVESGELTESDKLIVADSTQGAAPARQQQGRQGPRFIPFGGGFRR